MANKDQLYSLVSRLLENLNFRNVPPTVINRITDTLSNQNFPTRTTVQIAILSELKGLTTLKESVDFSDSNFWLDQIIEIIKRK